MKMEKIGHLGASNSLLQVQIDTLQQILDSIKSVLVGDIDWQSDVALSCVVNYLEEEIGLLVFQKEINKKEMSNLLLEAIKQ